MGELVADVREAVRSALGEGEVGLQVAAYADGRLIVDVAGGAMASGSAEPVDTTTLFPIFSAGKALVATAVHLQAERGFIGYDEPVSAYWPEYAAHGKDRVSIRHVLTHRAGVPAMPPEITLELTQQWDWVVERLADLPPVYPPGERNAYHPFAFGWILGEVVRRTDPLGRDFARFVQEEICQPLGIDAFRVGAGQPEFARVSLPAVAPQAATPAIPAALSLGPDGWRPDLRRVAMPGAGELANARSVARLYALLAGMGELDGVRLLSRERVLSFLRPRPDMMDFDETLGRDGVPYGMGGYYVAADPPAIAPSPPDHRIMMHPGAGGSFGWADLDAGFAMAVCRNQMAAPDALAPIASVFREWLQSRKGSGACA